MAERECLCEAMCADKACVRYMHYYITHTILQRRLSVRRKQAIIAHDSVLFVFRELGETNFMPKWMQMGHARSNRFHLKTDYLRCCCLIRISDGTVATIVNGLQRRGDNGTTKIVNILHEKDENLCWAVSILSALENVLQMHFAGLMEFLSWTQTSIPIQWHSLSLLMLVASVESRAHATDMHIIQAIQMRVT